MNRNEFNDHPTLEQQVARITERLANHIEDTRENEREVKTVLKELSDSVARLALLQREQNGNVSRIAERQTQHDNWHGANDDKIGQRLGILEQKDHDSMVMRGVWLSQWRALTASAVMGAGLATVINLAIRLL